MLRPRNLSTHQHGNGGPSGNSSRTIKFYRLNRQCCRRSLEIVTHSECACREAQMKKNDAYSTYTRSPISITFLIWVIEGVCRHISPRARSFLGETLWVIRITRDEHERSDTGYAITARQSAS